MTTVKNVFDIVMGISCEILFALVIVGGAFLICLLVFFAYL